MIRIREVVEVFQRDRASFTNGYSNQLICITNIPQKDDLQREADLLKMFCYFKDRNVKQ